MNSKVLADYHGIELETRKVHGTVWVLIFCAVVYDSISNIYGLFSVMEQIRSGEILFNAMKNKQEEKRKLKKLKKGQRF